MGALKLIENPSTGYSEVIDCATNAVIAIEKRRKPPRKRWSERPPGRPTKVAVVSATQQQRKNQTKLPKRLYDFDPVIAEKICDAVIVGARLSMLKPKQGFPPYHVICRWRRENPDFNQQILVSVQCRALYFEEMIYEIAEKLKDLKDVKSARLKVKVLQWLAARNDPETYDLKRRHRRRKLPAFVTR